MDGGPTSLDNLVILCRFHHRLLHEAGYRMRVDAPGRFTFFRPGGQPIPHVPPPLDGSAVVVVHANRDLGIDARTAVAEPYEPRPDIGVAVWGYLLAEAGAR